MQARRDRLYVLNKLKGEKARERRKTHLLRVKQQDAIKHVREIRTASKAEKALLPKRPLNAVFLYVQDKRPSYVAAHPGVPVTQVTRDLAAEWKNLSDAEKQVKRKHGTNLCNGLSCVTIYVHHANSTCFGNFFLLYQPYLSRAAAARADYESAKQRAPHVPKRPGNAYSRFLASRFKAVQTANPDAKAVEVAKLIAKEWKNVPAAEKVRIETTSASSHVLYDAIAT